MFFPCLYKWIQHGSLKSQLTSVQTRMFFVGGVLVNIMRQCDAVEHFYMFKDYFILNFLVYLKP